MGTFWQDLDVNTALWDFHSPSLLDYFVPQIATLGPYVTVKGALSTSFLDRGVIAYIPDAYGQFSPLYTYTDTIFPAVYKEYLYLNYTRTWIIPVHFSYGGGGAPNFWLDDFLIKGINLAGTMGTLYLDGIVYLRGDERDGDTPHLYKKESLTYRSYFDSYPSEPATVITEWRSSRINLRLFYGRLRNRYLLGISGNSWPDIADYSTYPAATGNYTYPGIVMGKDRETGIWYPTLLGVDEQKGLLRLPARQFDQYTKKADISLDGIRFIPDSNNITTTAYGTPDSNISTFWQHNYTFGARPYAPFNYSSIASANIAVHITDRALAAPMDYVIGRLSDATGQLSPAHPMTFPAIIYDSNQSLPPQDRWKASHVTVRNGEGPGFDYGIPQTIITFSRYEHLGLTDFHLWASPFWTMAKDPFR